jgi:hypothetical protein
VSYKREQRQNTKLNKGNIDEQNEKLKRKIKNMKNPK